MSPGQSWNEASLSEDPAVEHLLALGYTYVGPEALEAERESQKDVVLAKRLAAAVRRLNPWLSEDNVNAAVRAVTHVPAASLLEASEKAHAKLTGGVSLVEDRGEGKRSYDVRFFDFEAPANNELIVTRQFRVQGSKKNIRPDLVVFVNGVPLVVIECKSPTLGEGWKAEAIDQFSRYQELEPKYKELGAPRLFELVQVLVVTCGSAAVYGTVTTPHRHYAAWKTMWPAREEDFAKARGRAPNAQEVLFTGLLAPANLLDVVRNFVVFERDPKTGRTVRKLCRYQQFGAVNKALARADAPGGGSERGGVVWHTQGSGKSLTMLWLALKLRREGRHEKPTLVLVTDRKDLDDQITGTFMACGFPAPTQAASVRHLRELISGPNGSTILTTVQKFQELEGRVSEPSILGEGRVSEPSILGEGRVSEPSILGEGRVSEPSILGEGVEGAPLPGADAAKKRRKERAPFPVLSTAKNLFVLADEAHRTQYGGLAANLRRAMPNACFFGFTGTPIDKKDRSTLSTFGPYIDTYTIRQAVADGATVPIFYEGRLAELRILGATVDGVFDRVFSDRSDEERRAIKQKYGTEAAIAGAPRRVEAIALDVVEHFTTHIRPNGFKAQLVACSREVACAYKEALDALNAPASAVIISGSNKDDARLVAHHTSEEERKALIARYVKKDDPLSILVVCDMLLTGFDAPVEQVMYLDAPLREHTLLQAIARVNRTDDGKTYGLVVDYWGVSDALQEALAIFSPEDVAGAMTPKTDELPRLTTRREAALRFFAGVADKDDLDACVAALAPADVRAEFDDAFKRFAQSLDMLLPDVRALPFSGDARWLGKIRGAAAATYRDGKIDVSDCGAKVKKLIEDAVVAEGIQILVQRVSLFTPEFDKKLAALKSDDARGTELEHAIQGEIAEKMEENPAFFLTLRERLEKIVEDKKAKRLSAAQQLALFDALVKDLRGHAKAAEETGMSETAFAIYGVIAPPVQLHAAERTVDLPTRELASLLEEALAPQVGIVDWAQKEDVQREMRRLIKRALRVAKVEAPRIDPLAEGVVDLLKRRRRPS